VADKVTMPAIGDTSARAAAAAPIVTARTPEEITRIETLVRSALGVDSTRGDVLSVVSAPFDMPAPVVVSTDSVATPDMMTRIQTNPKPVVAIAALVVLLVVAVLSLSALKPKKGAAPQAADTRTLQAPAGYPELPASSQMQAAMMQNMNDMQHQQQMEEQRRPVILPPTITTPEREQAIATVEQRPDAAIRVTRSWLRT
jgi:flagellar M-ring protein FliF